MRQSDLLSEFVRKGLASGRSRQDLSRAMQAAGWSEDEIRQAQDGWSEAPGLPPVPRPRPYLSAREGLIFGLLFIALGAVSANIVILGFDMIELWLPDPTDTYYGPARISRLSIAMLIAFLPVFLILHRHMTREGGDKAARGRSLVRRWVASVTLLIAAVCLLGDLVVTVNAFLTGDLTWRFAAKALFVALVAVLVLSYYRGELDV